MKKLITAAIAAVILVSFVSLAAAGGKKETVPAMENATVATMDNSQAVPPPGITDGKYQKPAADKLMEELTPLQFQVTQANGTESPYNNVYWDNHNDGIYVDVVSGEPLFSSTDKYESGTGWPSFFKPLEEGNIISIKDVSYGMERIEVRSLFADSHLGHLFNDGPKPTGLRYCINSASLRFVPVEDMMKEGYDQYLALFK